MKLFKSNSIIGAHTRGTLWALILTLVSVLIFALFVTWGVSGSAISPIVQAVKVISIFFGVFIVLRGVSTKAWLHGAIFGLVYTVFAFLIFSIIDTNFSITTGFLIDSGFAVIIGAISAILIRLRKRGV